MNKAELVSATAALLRERGVRKEVRSPEYVFHISDDEGNHKDFKIKKTKKEVAYTAADVLAVIDACSDVICDRLKGGESVTVASFGTLGLKYRKARKTRRFDNGDWIDVEARYIPKFSFGNRLRQCAQLYALSLANREATQMYIGPEAEKAELGDG